MACCVFAAFIISQFFAAYEALLSLFGRKAKAPQPVWRLGMAAPSCAAQGGAAVFRAPPRVRTMVIVALGVELIILLSAGNWLLHGGADSVAREFARLATVRSFADLRDLCGV